MRPLDGDAPDRGGGIAAGLTRLADVLVTGLLVAVAALPVVTAYVAVCAGILTLRRAAERDGGVRVRDYVKALRAVAGSGVWPFLAPVCVGGLALVDLATLRAGLPGSRMLGPAMIVALGLVAVVLLRAGAMWHPGQRWPVVLAAAAVRVRRDPAGSILLLLAVMATGVLAASLGPLIWPLLPGMPVLATVAVERRADGDPALSGRRTAHPARQPGGGP